MGAAGDLAIAIVPHVIEGVQAGFADGAHFSRQYKETFGLSPSLRRKQAGTLAEGDRACMRVFD